MFASVGAPCLRPMAPMNSPLFYELDGGGGGYSSTSTTSRSDVCDKLKDSAAATVASSSSTAASVASRSSRPLRLNLNGAGGNVAASAVRGLAPIRVSNAVFGNGRNAGLAELESPSYVELADINTPEISLDLQVMPATLFISVYICL